MKAIKYFTSTLLLMAACIAPPTPSAPNTTPPAPRETVVALCSADEAGEKLEFNGRVLDYQAQPLAKAAVIAYHTDTTGLYNPRDSKTRVPRIRGVAVTDDAGRFRFKSIRPGAYPEDKEPANIHMIVTAPAHHPRFVNYWFEDDPLAPAQKHRLARDTNILIVKPVKDTSGTWTFSYDIQLSSN